MSYQLSPVGMKTWKSFTVDWDEDTDLSINRYIWDHILCDWNKTTHKLSC